MRDQLPPELCSCDLLLTDSSDSGGCRHLSASQNCLAELLAPASADLLETLPDAVVAVDHDGTIVQINSQTKSCLATTRDELIGQKVEMLVPESYRGQHHRHRETFAQTPKTRRMGADLDLYGRRRMARNSR